MAVNRGGASMTPAGKSGKSLDLEFNAMLILRSQRHQQCGWTNNPSNPNNPYSLNVQQAGYVLDISVLYLYQKELNTKPYCPCCKYHRYIRAIIRFDFSDPTCQTNPDSDPQPHSIHELLPSRPFSILLLIKLRSLIFSLFHTISVSKPTSASASNELFWRVVSHRPTQ